MRGGPALVLMKTDHDFAITSVRVRNERENAAPIAARPFSAVLTGECDLPVTKCAAPAERYRRVSVAGTHQTAARPRISPPGGRGRAAAIS